MTTKTSRQDDASTTKIDIDAEGTRLGKFNDDHDPIISYQRLTDGWMLAFKTSTGTACASLDVTGVDATTAAITAARKYLYTHKPTAVAPAGS